MMKQTCADVHFAIHLFLSFAGASWGSPTASSSCVPSPISAAIRNVTVANQGSNGIARGLALSIGTPAKEFAFLPHSFNNSLVYDQTNLCDVTYIGLSEDACITVRGGAYLASGSTTSKIQTSDTAFDSDPYPSTSVYSDTWTLNDQVTLTNYTFGVPNNDWGEQFYTPMAVLGLGRNSTFLNALKADGLISSRTWSFFWGLNGRNTQTNGSMVFGGYDQAKISGTAQYNGKLNYTNCDSGVQFEVDDLKLLFLNGTDQTLFDTSSSSDIPLPLYSCMDPGGSSMFAMPYNDYFSNFVTYTEYDSFNQKGLGNASVRSTGINWWNLEYLEGVSAYNGDLGLTIKDGPAVRVKNEGLVVPHVYMGEDTSTWEQDPSTSDLLINSIGQSGDYNAMSLSIGRYFFTYAYLMVNLDAGEFTIWAANSEANGNEDLVAVDETNAVVSTPLCSTTPGTGRPTSTATPSPNGGSSLSGGAIAGIAVGAAAAVALVAMGMWLLFKRNKKRAAAEKGSSSTTQDLMSPGGLELAGRPHENYQQDPNKLVNAYLDRSEVHSGTVGSGMTASTAPSELDSSRIPSTFEMQG